MAFNIQTKAMYRIASENVWPENNEIIFLLWKNIKKTSNYFDTYFVCSCQQIVCHLLQVWGLSCIDEAHHFLKDIWVHITDVNPVLRGKTKRLLPLCYSEWSLRTWTSILSNNYCACSVEANGSSYSYLFTLFHFMFKHSIKDRGSCC